MSLFATNLHSSRDRARLTPSQKECGIAKKDADLTDDRQIQGKWIVPSYRCAHPILQELQLRELIILDPMPRVNPDRDVQPSGKLEICNASETMSAIHSPEGPFSAHRENQDVAPGISENNKFPTA